MRKERIKRGKMMKKFAVTLKTVTPLWTGDAWGENTKIGPSSIMGSLRFWFEVICYFAGITNNSDYEGGRLNDDLNEKDFKKKIEENGTDFEGINKSLAESGISLPSRVFGCTGWRSLVEIKEIKEIEDYYYGNKLNLPNKICINKSDFSIKENGDCPSRSNNDWSIFYLSNPYFFGKFKVTFLVERNLIEAIFLPLLNFMQKYGFWSGKWNIGYGRLKVLEVEKDNSENNNQVKEIFEFSKFFKNNNDKFEDKKFSDFIDKANGFSDLENKTKKVLYKLENQNTNSNFSFIIKELIKIKVTERKNHKNNIRDNELRHLLFGTVKYPPRKEELPQGTKIIPWIYEKSGQLKGGFVSIAGIINLGE
jgi:CRISPR-associated protein Cmr1